MNPCYYVLLCTWLPPFVQSALITIDGSNENYIIAKDISLKADHIEKTAKVISNCKYKMN